MLSSSSQDKIGSEKHDIMNICPNTDLATESHME